VRADPFIDAEKAAGHRVNKCCKLLKVSRAAYHQQAAVPVSAARLVWSPLRI
jgi:hypothetical protein